MRPYHRQIGIGTTQPLQNYAFIKKHYGEIYRGGMPIYGRHLLAMQLVDGALIAARFKLNQQKLPF